MRMSLFDGCSSLKQGEKSIGIQGAREVLGTVIHLLENLPESQGSDDKVLLMIQGRTATIERFADDLQPRWYEAVKSALKKGWKVIHVVRLDEDLSRIKKMVRGFLLLVGHKGEYKPLAFKQKYVVPVAESFIVIPTLGKGMILYAGNQARFVDSAIYIEDETQIRILENHFMQLSDVMIPVFSILKQYSSVIPHFQRADRIPGNRIVILKRLSDIQRPDSFYQANSCWAKAHQKANGMDESELCETLAFRLGRQSHLISHSKNHDCKYIFTGNCIGRYLSSGKEMSLPGYVASTNEKLKQIQKYKSLMQQIHYDMALAEEDIFKQYDVPDTIKNPSMLPEIIPDFCEVLEDFLVVMRIPIYQDVEQIIESKWIVIEDPVIVKAFYQYLLEIWENRISQHRKDKFYTSSWLTSKENELRRVDN